MCKPNIQQNPEVGQHIYPRTSFSSTNKTERHNITEILLKVALNTIKPNQTNNYNFILQLLAT
jgi:hypothetical protein